MGKSFGLTIMRERAAQAGRQADRGVCPAGGTVVRLVFPQRGSNPASRRTILPGTAHEPITRIVLVDDHTLFRKGLAELLEQGGSIKVAAITGNADEVAMLLADASPRRAAARSQYAAASTASR